MMSIDVEGTITCRASLAERDGGQEVELALRYTRSGLAELTGRETERMIEPLELYAHLPGLLRGIGTLEQATSELYRVDQRFHALAELHEAPLTNCTDCTDLVARIFC